MLFRHFSPASLAGVFVSILVAIAVSFGLFRGCSHHATPRARITMTQLDALAEPYIQQAHAGVDAAVQELCSHKTRLFWDLGRDKIKKTHRTRDKIDAAMSARVLGPLKKAATIYSCAADQDAASLLVQGAAVESLQSALLAGAGLAVEGACVKATMQSVTAVVCRCAPRLAASWGLCGTCAVADGPLPIGDIIGVTLALGGTLWCAHDLCQAYRQLPRALGDAMYTSIDATIAQCRLEAASHL